MARYNQKTTLRSTCLTGVIEKNSLRAKKDKNAKKHTDVFFPIYKAVKINAIIHHQLCVRSLSSVKFWLVFFTFKIHFKSAKNTV